MHAGLSRHVVVDEPKVHCVVDCLCFQLTLRKDPVVCPRGSSWGHTFKVEDPRLIALRSC